MTALLEGRTCAVTGAARGIGAAVARRLADHGATVIIADIDAGHARATADAIASDTGRTVIGEHVDVADEADTEAAVERWVDRFGRIDGVVANAGILHLANVVDLNLADWRRVLDINLTGAFLTARAAARRMQAEQSGSIVFTSSLFGVRGGRENAAYSASKFGMIGLAQSLAAELAPHQVRVNSVCPGQVATEMIDQLVADRSSLTGQTPDQVLSALTSRVPMGRMGTVEEIADVFVFLLSDLSRYITGQALVVDGGWQVF